MVYWSRMRTLTDITPPSRRKDMVEPLGKPVPPGRDPLQLNEQPPRFPYMTLVVVTAIVAASVGALFYFSSAKVDVTPTTVSAAVQGSFTADKNGPLLFEVITAQKIAAQNVKGSGAKIVTSTASGTITIYNTQTRVQRLINNTRFATPTGLIFRIRSPVTVPGGSPARPGSVVAKVYADQPGSPYNVPPTSFSIPGLAGTPQASQVYARSSEAMTGGASGSVPIVDSTLESQTRSALMKALSAELLASVQAQVPSGYTLLEGAATTTFEALESAPSSVTGQVDIKEQGTVTAIVFPNAALAKAIGSSVSGLGYQGESLTILPVSNILFTVSNRLDPEAVSFSFTLSGTASLMYTVDPTRIAAAVAGKTRSAAEVALTNYPEVKRAVIILRPFWRKTFPQDPASISVVVQNP